MMPRISKLILGYLNVASAAFFTLLPLHSVFWYSLPQADGSTRGDLTSIQLNLVVASVAFAYLVHAIITAARITQGKGDVEGSKGTP